MFILDTNVLSELMSHFRGSPVLDWINPIQKDELFTTALNQAEILFGIAVREEGRARKRLAAFADSMFAEEFGGRILPFDEAAASHFAEITARRKRVGRPVGIIDSQIAAIARARAMSVVTRNVSHFQDCEVPIVDPWSR